jgi:ubiquinone/menaquinone biosynthesis C-methylase UbiE
MSKKEYEIYLNMQKNYYDTSAKQWSIEWKDPVVGSYETHNRWPHWEKLLFRDIDTSKMIALEYGCGPGRNLIKFNKLFARIDGVDISREVLNKAKLNLRSQSLYNDETRLIHCVGDEIPGPGDQYDFVFSTICLQHIACYSIRFNIFKEIYRVLKPGGILSFQMGFGKRPATTSCDYYADSIKAEHTNGKYDVRISNETPLKDDLTDKLNFKKYESIIVDSNKDNHENWIFVMVRKPHK